MGATAAGRVARGGGNAIYHRWFDGTAWRGWEPMAGTATSQPAAASAGAGRLDVLVRGRPVAVEGGVDDPGTERTPVTADRVDRFVDAAVDGGAIGGSHHDYATTQAALWTTLARLNAL